MEIKRGKRQLLQKPQRKIDKRQRTQFIVITVISAILIFLFFNIGKGVYDSVQIYLANKALETQIEELYTEKQELLTKKKQVESNESLESEAKKSLGVIKPDEKVLVLKDQ